MDTLKQGNALLTNADYSVGWISAISTEYVAAKVFLDEEHARPDLVTEHDNNDYTLGRIGRHNIVLAVLPDGEYGLTSAATVARDMLHSFPNIRIGLMVGIGGGAPWGENDIRLGDVVVSAIRNGSSGVFQYDFGKTIQNQSFQAMRFLDQSPTLLRTAVAGLRAQYETDGHQIKESIAAVLAKRPRLRKKYSQPDAATDRLYQSHVVHVDQGATDCAASCGDASSSIVHRSPRSDDEDNPAIHYGLIASANQLMKDAALRDKLGQEKGVLCFEMEAAGLMNHFPCLVIRGICDYSDTHKNKQWQGYAAMTAASYTRDLLRRIPPNKVEAEMRISDVLADVHTTATKIEAEVRALHLRFEDKEDIKISNWISPINYGSQQSDYLSRRQPGTGMWLLQSNEYQRWLGVRKTLFCPGIPGAGKTTLAAVVIDDLERRFANDPGVGIAYIYCNYKRQDDQTIGKLASSLLKQLTQTRSALPECVRGLYRRHQLKNTTPTPDEIWQALESVTALYDKVFVIIDALDECPTLQDCRNRLILGLFTLQKNVGANIFATSRFIPDIEQQFSNESITVEIRASAEDIHTYLHNRMPMLGGFVKRNLDLQKEIETVISAAVDGQFLLAQLYFDSLTQATSAREVKRALSLMAKDNKSKPVKEGGISTLSSAYDQAINRINSQGSGASRLAKKVLAWITFARWSLRMQQIQHALATERGDEDLDRDNLHDSDIIVAVCCGLVTFDEETKILRLIHYTTQNYLEETQNQWFPNVHTEMAITCITYLSFRTFGSIIENPEERERRTSKYPLYRYSMHYWGYHARLGSVYKETLSFLEKSTHVEAIGQILLDWNFLGTMDEVAPRGATALHLAAYAGLYDVVQALSKKGNVGEEFNVEYTPLALAVVGGHTDVVRLLLENGANPSVRHPANWGNPMCNAAVRGFNDIIILLHKAGIDINMGAGSSNRTPLMHAAEYGREHTVELLLELGADTEAESHGWKALTYAVRGGHEGIVRLLLTRGTLINTDDRSKLSQLAVSSGNKPIIELLLQRGIDITLGS